MVAERHNAYSRFARLAALVNAMIRDSLRDVATRAICEYVSRIPTMHEGGTMAAGVLAEQKRLSSSAHGSVQKHTGTDRRPLDTSITHSVGRHEALLLVQLKLGEGAPRPRPPDADPPKLHCSSVQKRQDHEFASQAWDAAAPQRSLLPMLHPPVETVSQSMVGALRELIMALSTQTGVRHSLLPPPTSLISSAASADKVVRGVGCISLGPTHRLRAVFTPSLCQVDEGAELHPVHMDEPVVVDALARVATSVVEHWALPSLLCLRCGPSTAVVVDEFSVALEALKEKRTQIVDAALQHMQAEHAAEVNAAHEAHERDIAEQIQAAHKEVHTLRDLDPTTQTEVNQPWLLSTPGHRAFSCRQGGGWHAQD